MRHTSDTVYRIADKETYLYRYFDKKMKLLYIGITHNLKSRESMHRQHSEFWPLVKCRDLEPYESRELAHKAEREAIGEENPPWNQTGRRPTPQTPRRRPPRYKTDGLELVDVWVPQGDRRKVVAFARNLRKKK